MKVIPNYQSSLMILFILLMGVGILGCGGGKFSNVLGMRSESDEEIDFSRIPTELRATVTRSIESKRHYRQKAVETTKELEKVANELRKQKQENANEIAQFRTELTSNMLQLGVSLEEITAALGGPTNVQDQEHLQRREHLLQDIREQGPTLLQKIKEQRQHRATSRIISSSSAD